MNSIPRPEADQKIGLSAINPLGLRLLASAQAMLPNPRFTRTFCVHSSLKRIDTVIYLCRYENGRKNQSISTKTACISLGFGTSVGANREGRTGASARRCSCRGSKKKRRQGTRRKSGCYTAHPRPSPSSRSRGAFGHPIGLAGTDHPKQEGNVLLCARFQKDLPCHIGPRVITENCHI